MTTSAVGTRPSLSQIETTDLEQLPSRSAIGQAIASNTVVQSASGSSAPSYLASLPPPQLQSPPPPKATAAEQWAEFDSKSAEHNQKLQQFKDEEAAYNRYTAERDGFSKASQTAKRTNKEVDDQLNKLPGYFKAVRALDEMAGRVGTIFGDGRITWGELRELATGKIGFLPFASEEQIQSYIAAAKFLVDNPSLFKRATGGFDDDISVIDLGRETPSENEAKLRQEIEDRRVTEPTEPQPPAGGRPVPPGPAPVPPQVPRPNGSGAPGATASTTNAASGSPTPTTSASSGSSAPTPTDSSGAGASGMAGMLDRAQGRVNTIEAKLNRLSDLESRDPASLSDQEKAELSALKSQEARLTQDMTNALNKLKMLSELYSSISKMFSDISMSIIRNIG